MICPVFICTMEVPMKRTELLQEIRMMRFQEACDGWQGGKLTQQEAARLVG